MLRQRLWVAAVFLPVFVALIFWNQTAPLFGLFLAGLSLAVWELDKLLRGRGLFLRKPLVLAAVWGFGLCSALGPVETGELGLWLALIGLASGAALAAMEMFRPDLEKSPANLAVNGLAVLGLGSLGSFLFLLRRLPEGASWLILLFGFNWLYDAGAFFIGRAFGRRPLAPVISPAKTLEGVIGGLAVNTAAAVAAYYFWLSPMLGFTLPGLVGLGLGMGLLAQLGDLLESLLKRWSKVKDSSEWIPGHGGLLDKLDSAVFTAPVLYVVARLFLHQ